MKKVMRVEPVIHTQDLKDMLGHEIESLMELSDRLSETGEPIGSQDKKRIRNILANGWLYDIQSEIEMSFRLGHMDNVKEGLQTITNVLSQFR